MNSKWDHFWFQPVPARPLAMARILFFATVFVVYCFGDRALYVATVLGLSQPATILLRAVELLWLASLLLSSIGLWARVSMGVAAVLGFPLLGLRSIIGPFVYQDSIVAIALIVFAISRAGDYLSLDRRGHEAPAANGEYGWPLQILLAVFLTLFFASGVAKLRVSGMDWWRTDILNAALANQYFGFLEGDRTHVTGGYTFLKNLPWLNPWISTSTLVLELAAPLAFFFRRLRGPFLVAFFGMQLGIYWLFGWVPYGYFAYYVLFLPWSKWLGERNR